MFKPIIFLAMLIASSQMCLGQSDTAYYDKDWKKTNSAGATYICGYIKEGENKYYAKCYNKIRNALAMKGYCVSMDSISKIGAIEFFDEHGFKSTGDYKVNYKNTGTYQTYHPSMYVYDTTMSIWYAELFINGKLRELHSYYKSGKLKRLELHDSFDSTKVTGQCYDEHGNEIVFTPFEQLPIPPYIISTFLKKKLKYPAQSKKNNVEGTVLVSFVVDTDGSLYNIEAITHVSPDIDDEAVRVVSKMESWIPGKMDDMPAPTKYKLPITFKLK